MKLEEIMSAKQPVTSGNLLWKRVMQEVHNKSMQQLMYEQKYAWTHERVERPHVTVKKNWMPTTTWKDGSLILHAAPERKLLIFTHTKAMTTFAIDLAVATLGNFCFNSGQLCSGPCEAWFLTKTNSRWRREARRTTADYNGIEEA